MHQGQRVAAINRILNMPESSSATELRPTAEQIWYRETSRLELEVYSLLMSPFRSHEWKPLPHVQNRSMRFRFQRCGDGSLIFAIRGDTLAEYGIDDVFKYFLDVSQEKTHKNLPSFPTKKSSPPPLALWTGRGRMEVHL